MDLDVNHPVIQRVDAEVFRATFATDCLQHQCRCRAEGDRRRDDACCQHGADVFVPEKQAILRRAEAIASVLKPDRREPGRWFDERDPERDPGAPEGLVLRTSTADPDDQSSGCVFLQHDGARGCGLHRAAIVNGFDPAEIKPMVCRLYPLSWNDGRLQLSADFDRYSCAGSEGPSVYRLLRATIGDIFGPALLRELDRCEANAGRARLRVLAGGPLLEGAVE